MAIETISAPSGLAELLSRAIEVDGIAALNEESDRARAAGPVQALTAEVDGVLAGYAEVHDGAAQLVVHPDYRGRGIGTQLARELTKAGLQLWSFGAQPAAQRVAEKLGLQSVRELLVMGRSLTDLPAPTPIPDGLTIRGFTPDDEARILQINAQAFSHHPEQGSMDAADFAQRCAQPWFDPAGLLVAERDGQIVGFHWTKRRDEVDGEVYVIAVDPQSHGGGIGKTLLWTGLRHLAAQELQRVLLWVEGDQTSAVTLYEKSGFAVLNRDIVFSVAS